MRYREFLKKLVFHNPKRSDILLLHRDNTGILRKIIFEGIDYTELPADKEVFYITPQICLHLIKNVFLRLPLLLRYRCKYLLYILSCIEYIRPRIVITFIDNSNIFQIISRIYSKAEFYAIQNGIKNINSVKYWLPEQPKMGSIISMTNLLCFGQSDIDLLKRHGHTIDRYHPVGALIGGYYRSKVAVKEAPVEFDICLVSQWRRSIMSGEVFTEFKNGFAAMDSRLSRYIRERKRSLCIARCSNDTAEEDYFRRIFGEEANLVEYDQLNLSSYAAMDRSSVIVSFNSAAALEAFGWGKKVLFCNFTGERRHDFALEGPWFLSEGDYPEFKERMDYLFALDNSEYLRMTAEARKYVMNYDFSMPAHAYIHSIMQKKGLAICLTEKQYS